MLRKGLPMNLDDAPAAVRPERTMIAAVEEMETADLEVKKPFIMQCVPVVGLKLKYHSNPSRIGKYYVGIVFVPKTIIGKKYATIQGGVFLFRYDLISNLGV
jgi:hypothetical protein